MDELRRAAARMTADELRGMIDELRAALAEALAPSGEPARCPRCGCASRVRRGRDAAGRQRWLCRGCGRSCTSASCGLLARSKLPASAWMEFAACTADAVPLREAARRCGTSLATAWFMRMRACEVMASALPRFRGAGRAQVDGTYLHESMSGNHSRSRSFSMPREPHRNGRGVRGAGSKDLMVCVLTGVGEAGDAFAEALCRGVPGSDLIKGAPGGRVGAGSEVETDGPRAYRRPLRELGAAHTAHSLNAGASRGALGMVNAQHSRLADFLRPLHGVSTRRLPRYLGWFCWREMMRAPGEDPGEVIYRHEASGTYSGTRRALQAEPHPFMEKWSVSTVV